MGYSAKEIVELFHLMFLRQFDHQTTANLYAIKGGCNLRFFFNSIRYSEDLDLDIQTVQQLTLENKVTKIINAPPLLALLQGYGVSKIEATTPKQTPTTQRWKIQLHVAHLSMPLHTKIEFSRRQDKFESQPESIGIAICQKYRLPPSRLSHYPLKEAIAQKILALAHRSITQSRDVFDLYHLLHIASPPKLVIARESIEKAEESLLSIHFDDYKSQVVNFLESDHQKIFDNKAYWETINNTVLSYLQELSP